jgi:SEC-C motif domain protein
MQCLSDIDWCNMKKKAPVNNCPCGSGKPLDVCCGLYINGTLAAPTAEILMRSRYTAYSMQNESYLLETWHSNTRPGHVEMDPSIQWIRLEIINSSYDHVEFIATYKVQGKAHKLHENSRFVYENQKWFYLDAL